MDEKSGEGARRRRGGGGWKRRQGGIENIFFSSKNLIKIIKIDGMNTFEAYTTFSKLCGIFVI